LLGVLAEDLVAEVAEGGEDGTGGSAVCGEVSIDGWTHDRHRARQSSRLHLRRQIPRHERLRQAPVWMLARPLVAGGVDGFDPLDARAWEVDGPSTRRRRGGRWGGRRRRLHAHMESGLPCPTAHAPLLQRSGLLRFARGAFPGRGEPRLRPVIMAGGDLAVGGAGRHAAVEGTVGSHRFSTVDFAAVAAGVSTEASAWASLALSIAFSSRVR